VKPVHPAHREKYFAYVKAKRTEPVPETPAGEKAEAAPHCLRGRKRDGAEFPMNLGLSTIDTEDGILVIAAVRDTTDSEKENEQRERMSQLEALVEHSEDAVVSIGPDGVITTWNPAAEKMYGVSSEEMIGQSGWLTSPDHSPR
jgi:PAS domain-containing protein